MLPKSHRLTSADDFKRTIRGGHKAVRGSVIVYGLRALESDSADPTRIGVTVSKAVGGSVTRHRVARVIRHTMAEELTNLPAGSSWVIRALPEAATSPLVADDVRLGVDAICRRLGVGGS